MRTPTILVFPSLLLALAAGCSDSEGAAPETESADEALSARPQSCHVVEVTSLNNDMFEEGLGSIYDIDDEGNAGSDEDSISFSIDPDPKGLSIRIGQMRFPREPGETAEAVALPKESPFTAFLIKRKGASSIEVRIFKQNKLGVVLVKKTASARAERLATLDCRKSTLAPTRP